ncbi:MAG: riboflavin synthase [Candidatus Bipolaricaulota bacterium]
MFTGMIEKLGELKNRARHRFTFSFPGDMKALKIGGSISVNGSCLTVVEIRRDKGAFEVDLSAETLHRTTLSKIQPGDKVNMELPLEASSLSNRLEGHFVQGHVDDISRVLGISRKGNDYIFRFALPAQYRDLVVEKGSIAIEGIGLTPYEVSRSSFLTSVVPHTYSQTTLQYKRPGAEVNLEFDVLAKYVQANGP